MTPLKFSISPLFTHPFNVRFETLLKRWTEHQQLVELEIALMSNSQQIDVSERIEEMLRKFITANAFLDRHENQPRASMTDRGEISLLVTKTALVDAHILLLELLEKVQSWINSPRWLRLFEIAQYRRVDNSTEWFTHHELVTQWILGAKSQTGFSDTPVHLLSVQGKHPQSYHGL